MPKSSPTASPPTSNTIPKPTLDAAARMTDVALRKKKNADAQAAFRARRANYIATLEETVTSLESVVIQLQESCRESRAEAIELRQENNRLRMEQRERERFWRALYHAKKTGQAPEVDDLTPPPPPMSSPFLGHAQVATMPSHSTSLVPQQYGNSLGFRDESVIRQGPYNGTSGNGPPNFSNQPSPAPFPNNEVSSDGSSSSSINPRGNKYSPYSFPMSGDGRWQVGSTVIPSTGEPITPPHSQSPVYTESPSLTSAEMLVYPGRFSADEQKTALNSVLDSAPYVFPSGDRFNQHLTDSVPNSRSMSPTASTTSSTTSLPLTSSFQFTFHEASPGQDCTEFDYRRQSLPHCPEVTLHGGTADVSLTGQPSDAVRYRASRRPDLSADHQSMLGTHDSTQHDQSDGDVPFNAHHTIRSRRDTIPPRSRSTSPGPAPLSCTVAVIKAQAFGALRRTRARTKKTSDGAVKVAMDVLEARGIEIGSVSAGSKRPRMDDEVMEAETP
ncbi:hypothetical protein CPB84DRAFT_706994 [Gymnopilus junonius]|uniref:BZIP domain-containing protein n=1 Tax=Gymnopilus junonius TaxID=109634 RepID=A0A9P5TEY8_GYMJU|nr:hypothetical protein CPB84DRAFT_706994 [Gymnopilus junonius]